MLWGGGLVGRKVHGCGIVFVLFWWLLVFSELEIGGGWRLELVA
jgi:hypothetical protein